MIMSSGGGSGTSGNSGGGGSSGNGGGNSNYGSRGSGSSSSSRGGSGGGNRPECNNSGNDVRMAGGSGSQGHGSNGGNVQKEAVSELNTMNSDVSSLPFNFDNFWENIKSKMGFINWDAINKGRVPPPSTRALLYFRRLWENFKRNTPYFNWKQIEGSDLSSLQKRAGGADQFSQPDAARQDLSADSSKNYYNNPQVNPTYSWQYYAKTTAKAGVTPSSSASRAQPGLLKWLKFW